MPQIIKILIGSLLVLVAFFAQTTFAGDEASPVSRKMVSTGPLPNVPGHNLTAVTVDLAPGTSVPSHRHEAFVFVYVIEGVVRSKLDDSEAVNYATGESWVEPPGVIHSLTENPSDTKPARILAVFVARDGAKLTTSGEIEQ